MTSKSCDLRRLKRIDQADNRTVRSQCSRDQSTQEVEEKPHVVVPFILHETTNPAFDARIVFGDETGSGIKTFTWEHGADFDLVTSVVVSVDAEKRRRGRDKG